MYYMQIQVNLVENRPINSPSKTYSLPVVTHERVPGADALDRVSQRAAWESGRAFPLPCPSWQEVMLFKKRISTKYFYIYAFCFIVSTLVATGGLRWGLHLYVGIRSVYLGKQEGCWGEIRGLWIEQKDGKNNMS